MHNLVRIAPAVDFLFFDGNCQVRTAKGNFTIDGGEMLFRSLQDTAVDGAISEESIMDLLSENLGDNQASKNFYAFLFEQQVLVPSNSTPIHTRHEQELYSRYVLQPDDAMVKDLRSIDSIHVCGNEFLVNSVHDKSEYCPVEIKDLPHEADLIFFLAYGLSRRELLKQNELLLNYGKPIFYIGIERATLAIGPLVIPGRTACYECLYRRMHANALHKSEFIAYRDFQPDSKTTDPVVTGILRNILFNELKKLRLCNINAVPIGRFVELDLGNYNSTNRHIVRVPRCPACSALHSKPTPSLRDAV